MAYDVVIVGAGIVGAACAASLSAAGLSVIVVDANGVAGGTTAAGMGHIVVMDDSEAQFALTKFSQKLWADLSSELPASCEYESCGTIWVAADEKEMEVVRRKYGFYNEQGLAAEVLDGRSLREAEPNLGHGIAGGLLVTSDSVVYPLCATQFLLNKAKMRRTAITIGRKVTEIADDGVRMADGETVSAGCVVNAAGTAAPELSPGLAITKRKGHLVITERYPHFARHQLVELGYLRSAHGREADSVAFNLQPRRTGQVLLGSSRQFGSQDGGIDISILRRMTERAFDYMPKLRDLVATRVWTGFRPATPDNLPFIGKCPRHEKVYVAAGHEGLGITTALATGELITDQIVGRDSAIPIEPYSPSRLFG